MREYNENLHFCRSAWLSGRQTNGLATNDTPLGSFLSVPDLSSTRSFCIQFRRTGSIVVLVVVADDDAPGDDAAVDATDGPASLC